MSRENVEIVRRATEAMLGGDVATALDALDPEVEWHGTVGGLEEGRVSRSTGACSREEIVRRSGSKLGLWSHTDPNPNLEVDGSFAAALRQKR
jgi:hypothetical protein